MPAGGGDVCSDAGRSVVDAAEPSYVAVFGAIFSSTLNADLDHLAGLREDFDAQVIQRGPDAIAALPAGTREEVVDAFADSLHVVFLWAIPVAAVAFVVSLFLRERSLREWAHVGSGSAPAETAGASKPLPDSPTAS